MVKITVDEQGCKGCGLCEDACPKRIMKKRAGALNAKGFHPAGCADLEACIGCGFCAIMCPESVIIVEKGE